ncbi:MAG: thioredoxin domain-containing protein [Candidatus Dojkabacteria bacterium]
MAEETKKSQEVKAATVTINIDKFLMPGAIFLSALVLSASLFFGLNNIATKVGSVTTTTGTTTTTPPAATGAVTVTADQIKSLYSLSNGIKFGDDSKKVTFVEFSDPSCPYCHIAGGKNAELNKSSGFTLVADGGTYTAPVPEFKKLVDEGKASYMWFYTNGHGNGEVGTRALYCAHEQGKFWDMHDYLYGADGYSIQNDTVKNDTTKYDTLITAMKGKTGGVNLDNLKSCLNSGKYDSRLTEDQAKGTELGVSGTPGFFVNETNFAGAYSYTDMQSAVDTALAK